MLYNGTAWTFDLKPAGIPQFAGTNTTGAGSASLDGERATHLDSGQDRGQQHSLCSCLEVERLTRSVASEDSLLRAPKQENSQRNPRPTGAEKGLKRLKLLE
jgi:hypothetical protein